MSTFAKTRITRNTPSCLYHYTDAAGAIGIFSDHELWCTRIQYLNDSRELIASILSDELLSKEPGAIAVGLAQVVDRMMHADADLFVLDEDGEALIDPAGQRRPLWMPSTLATLATTASQPMDIDLSANSPLARLPADERGWIEQRRYDLLMPLRARAGGLIGMFGFRVTASLYALTGVVFSILIAWRWRTQLWPARAREVALTETGTPSPVAASHDRHQAPARPASLS